jgi:3-oxoadipyl-CoA thiolase
MGNFALVDAMYRDGFQCPLSNLIMGETAEILGRQHGITRGVGLLRSREPTEGEGRHRRGHFSREIAPVSVGGTAAPGVFRTVVDRDEHPRETTIDSPRLPPVFGEVEGQPGIITAGTSSGITDGGAAVVIASADAAGTRGLQARARIVGWASAGVDPRIKASVRFPRFTSSPSGPV